MISDEERREVARRLRKAIGLHEFAEVFGFDWTDDSDWGWKDVSNLVADLIEPTCDRDTPQKVAEEMFGKMRHSTKEEADAYDAMLKSKSVEIHPVDRDALLELAEKLDGLGLSGFSSGWSSGAVNVGFFARRIREALGVES